MKFLLPPIKTLESMPQTFGYKYQSYSILKKCHTQDAAESGLPSTVITSEIFYDIAGLILADSQRSAVEITEPLKMSGQCVDFIIHDQPVRQQLSVK